MILDDLGLLLQTAGIGTLGISLFKGSVPQEMPSVAVQHALVALIEVPGLPSERVHNGRTESIEQPVIQVLARGEPHDYVEARTRAQAAYDALDGLTNLTISGTFYLWLQALQSPFLLRWDELARPVIIFNLRVGKALTPMVPLVPLTSYSHAFLGQTLVTVPGSIHRLGTPRLLYTVYDAQVPAAQVQAGRATVDPESGDVQVSFAQPQSGTLLLSSAATPTVSVAFSDAISVTILGSEHGLGTKDVLVGVYDAGDPAAAIQASTITVNQTTYDVTVTFAAAQSGTIVLYGAV